LVKAKNIAGFQLPISDWQLARVNKKIGNRQLEIDND